MEKLHHGLESADRTHKHLYMETHKLALHIHCDSLVRCGIATRGDTSNFNFSHCLSASIHLQSDPDNPRSRLGNVTAEGKKCIRKTEGGGALTGRVCDARAKRRQIV